MKNKKLFKKIAPIVMSVAVAMTSLPVGVFAEDFTSGDGVTAEEYVAEDIYEDTYEEIEENSAPADDGFGSGETASEEESFGDGETVSEADVFTDDVNAVGEGKAIEGVQYVLMNIPYEEFYRSELKNNSVKVDAFTSATLNKSRTTGMMNGNAAYHTDAAGTNLAGITFPVKVNDASVLANLKQVTDDSSVTISVTNRVQTSPNTSTGKNALIESDSHSYYALTEAPAYYKELAVDANGNFSFGAVQGMGTKTVSIASTFTTETQYGDYELDLNDETLGSILNTSEDNIYGAVINTADGTTYALRHLENIWRGGHLAWSTGFTTTVHGGPVSSAHYKSMMGKTISSVIYYTNKGIINFDTEDTYVPVITGAAATAADVKTTDTALKVEITGSLPEDFNKAYTVDGVKAEIKDGAVAIANLTPGTHTVTVFDANGKYASISASFIAKTDVMPAAYDEYDNKLVAAADITAEQLAAYTKAVSKVKIGEKEYAASGRGSVKIVQEDGSLDYSKATINDGDTVVVSAAGYEDLTFIYHENVYVYAGLTWAEYWSSEDVYNAGSAASSDVADRRGEKDLGAFDAVTRATANHGLHRGSFQAIAVLNGKTISHWSDDGKTVYYTDGTSEAFDRNNVKGYQVTGLKYVPIQIKRADLTEFAKTHAIVKNGGQLIGGYGENQLKSYTATANVTANTNGLKKVIKAEDGSFVIGARQTGMDSGIKDTALKEAAGITATVKPGNGSYGEFLRVDLTGNYGDLGANLQSVEWAYYGNDSSYTTKLANYGTKFAADNWMHKAMGIQLGLTESGRCKLPEGYDGAGYWTLTVHALGYKDYTIRFQATAENIAKPAGDADSTPLVTIIAEAKALKEEDYTPASWAAAKDNIANELEECEDMLANIKNQTTYGVEEQIGHLREALNTLVKAEFKLNKTKLSLNTYKTKKATLKVTTNLEGTVKWKSSNKKIVTVSSKGVVTVKKAGKATITATLNGKKVTCAVTVSGPGISAKAKNATIYTAGTKTTTISVTKKGVSGTAKFKSSNKKIATVSSKGVVTAKKAGKVTITVTVGKYSKKVTITVKKPTLKLAKTSASIKVGKKTTIKPTATPSGKVTYKSSNKKIATVNSKGVVKGVKKGKTTITVKCNGVTQKFTVTVK